MKSFTKSVSLGSLRERAKGTWQARFRVTELDGSKHTVSRTFEATSKRKAEIIKSQLRSELLAEGCASHNDMPLADYLEEYKTLRRESGLIEAATATNYEASTRRICQHMDAQRAVGAIMPDDIVSMQSSMLRAGLCRNTVAKDFRFLKQVMLYAEDMGHIGKTPFVRSLKPPRKTKPVPNALDAKSRLVLVRFVESMPVCRLRIAIKLGLLEGMRREEVCGLRWPDISFELCVASINIAIGMDHNVPYIKDPKSETSRRSVPLEPGLMEDLKAWRSMRSSSGRPPRGFILGDGDEFWSPVMLTKEFSSLSRALGLTGVSGDRATFHDLRHTFATNLLDSHVSPRTVADLLGHADPSMTLRVYASTTEVGMQQAIEAIGSLASGVTVQRLLETRQSANNGTCWDSMGLVGP